MMWILKGVLLWCLASIPYLIRNKIDVIDPLTPFPGSKK
jgi:hypothetical protein